MFVRVRAGIDVVVGEAIWEMQTVDPTTGIIALTCKIII